MITQGQATMLGARIHTFVGLAFVGSFSLLMGLLIWQAAFNENPVADVLASQMYGQTSAQSQGN